MVESPEFNGLILIDKPKGISSFGVISQLRQFTAIKKVGHSGTLDPFATGLLPVLFGRYTKLSQYLENTSKSYLTSFVIGKETDTLDETGKIIAEIDSDILEKSILTGELEKKLNDLLLKKFTGKIKQIPPMYSALKVAGKPLYKYAREGETIDRKKRSVEIYKAELSEIYKKNDQWLCDARITCSKGTYIRTWIDDLAKSANCLAYAKDLRRLEVGHLSLTSNSVSLSQLTELFEKNNKDQVLMRKSLKEKYFYPISQALANIPIYELNQQEAKRVVHGQKLTLNNFDAIDTSNDIQLTYNDKLIAIVNYNPLDSDFVKYKRVLADKI